MIAASTITSFSLVKWGYRRPILVGTVLVGTGLALFAFQPQGISLFGAGVWRNAVLFVIIGLCGLGHGMATPAANNACIELMPDKVATITGLTGDVPQPGQRHRHRRFDGRHPLRPDVQRAYYYVFLAPVAILLVAIPFVFLMPASAMVSPSRAATTPGN